MNILENKNIKFSYAGLFSTKEEWLHPKRTEVTYEIIYVTSGTVHIKDEILGELSLKKGNLILLKPGTLHYGTKTSKDVSFYWLHFHLKKPYEFKSLYLETFDNPYIFKELLHFAFLPEKPSNLINAVIVRILCEVFFLSEEKPKNSNKVAEEIYEWIRVYSDASLSVKKVASHFGFSPDHLSRIFKKSYGTGVKSVIDSFILSKSKELLVNTGKYIKEIAYELKFENDKTFIGFFKYHEGISPSDFRNKFYKIHLNKQ